MTTQVQRVRRLYKTILKLNRGLPVELQALGDHYARDEFKRHKKCNKAEASVFMDEWTKYAVMLAEQLGIRGPKTGTKKIGLQLGEEDINKLQDEQIYQLYELMQAAKDPYAKENR